MLAAIIGGVIAWAVCNESVTIPPKSLVRQWRAETASPRRRA